MASAEQRARRRAQRETARRVRENTTVLGRQTARARSAREDYIEHLRQHPEDITPADHKELARRASYAQWERRKPGTHPNANSSDYDNWSQFFYRTRK